MTASWSYRLDGLVHLADGRGKKMEGLVVTGSKAGTREPRRFLRSPQYCYTDTILDSSLLNVPQDGVRSRDTIVNDSFAKGLPKMAGFFNSGSPTADLVMQALAKVDEPELHKDLVTLNMIRDLTVNGGEVGFTIVLTTPACPLRGKIEQDA